MGEENVLRFVQSVNVEPASVFRAFTNAAAIRGWLCNNAQIDARQGGRLYLHWNEGYYASGEFASVEDSAALGFSWLGRNDAATTAVNATFASKNGGTEVILTHSGVGSGKEWAETREELIKGWENGLANLKSVLETGLDKRVYDRPFLGILISGIVDEKQASRLGIPVNYGIQIGGTLANSGAEAAGFESGDVLTTLAGVAMESFQILSDTIAGYNAGDRVDVQFYRQGRKHDVEMQLSHRPHPDVPETAGALAVRLKELHAKLDAELDDIVAGASEAQASRAQEGEWNARQILTHLMQSERTDQMNLVLQVGGQSPAQYATNTVFPAAALSTVLPKFADQVAAWKRIEAETVALVECLPEEFVSRKADYLNLASSLLFSTPVHTRGHFEQIREAISLPELEEESSQS